MSRVEEALRRAQQQSEGGTTVVEQDPAAAVLDLEINTLAEEPFPIEMREHRRPRKPAAETPAATPAPAAVEPGTAAPAIQAVTPKGSTIMQFGGGTLAEKIVVDQHMSGVSREQYRRLAGILHHSQLSTGLAVVMVTSPRTPTRSAREEAKVVRSIYFPVPISI